MRCDAEDIIGTMRFVVEDDAPKGLEWVGVVGVRDVVVEGGGSISAVSRKFVDGRGSAFAGESDGGVGTCEGDDLGEGGTIE